MDSSRDSEEATFDQQIRNQVELEMRRVFPNFFASSQGSSQFSSTSAGSQQVQRQQVPLTSNRSRSIGTIEGLINRVQRNVSCNPSPMRNRGVVEQSRTAPYKLAYRQHSGKRKASVSGRSFVEDIVMVDSSDENVPRGLRRQRLHEAGLVVSFMEFNTLWKDVVIQTIENAFKNVLDESQSHPRFEFLQVCGSKLLKPNVPLSHSWTGEKIQKLAKQGDVYIRPTYEFSVQEKVVDSENDHELDGHNAEGSTVDNKSATLPNQPPRTLSPQPSGTVPAQPQGTTPSHPGPLGTVLHHTRTHTPHPLGTAPPLPTGNKPTGTQPAGTAPNQPMDFHSQLIRSTLFVRSTSEKVQALRECFPDIEESVLIDTLRECDGDTSDAAQMLLPSAPEPQLTPSGGADEPCCSKDVDQTPQGLSPTDILREHGAKFKSEKSFDLVVKRDKLWRSALSFYKNCLHHPERLFHELRIEFEGEEGVDAGALRREFFQCLMKEMNDNLFEGALTQRVPKRDSNIEKNLQSAGMMIGHSIMQGGPSFPCLCPAVSSLLVFGDKEKALEELLSVNDIPKNAATFGIINLIEELDSASTNEEIDVVLDKNENMALINASNWPPTQMITTASKSSLLQELVYQELIEKRFKQILDLRKGLQMFRLTSLMRRYPDQLRSLLVYGGSSLDAETMLGLFHFGSPREDEREQATVHWLKEYIQARSTEKEGDGLDGKVRANLGDILQFLTGIRRVPPLGMTKKINIYFHSDSAKVLPESSACFNMLYLPLNMQSESGFYECFDKAVLFSLNYFGQE